MDLEICVMHCEILLALRKRDLHVMGFLNANWVRVLGKKKSISIYNSLLNNNVISWSSKKERFIAWSIKKATTIKSLVLVQEAVWLRKFLQN